MPLLWFAPPFHRLELPRFASPCSCRPIRINAVARQHDPYLRCCFAVTLRHQSCLSQAFAIQNISEPFPTLPLRYFDLSTLHLRSKSNRSTSIATRSVQTNAIATQTKPVLMRSVPNPGFCYSAQITATLLPRTTVRILCSAQHRLGMLSITFAPRYFALPLQNIDWL